MIPALIGGLALGMGAYYNVGRALDNRKYWNDYAKNTGYYPRYGYLSGYYNDFMYGSRSLGAIYGISKRW